MKRALLSKEEKSIYIKSKELFDKSMTLDEYLSIIASSPPILKQSFRFLGLLKGSKKVRNYIRKKYFWNKPLVRTKVFVGPDIMVRSIGEVRECLEKFRPTRVHTRLRVLNWIVGCHYGKYKALVEARGTKGLSHEGRVYIEEELCKAYKLSEGLDELLEEYETKTRWFIR